jgi:hypothetical protein
VNRPFPLHHLLFALVPTLFLYSYNASKLPMAPSELLLPLAVSFAAALFLWLFVWLMLNNSRRAALIVSLFLALFFTYGRVLDAIGTAVPPQLLPGIAGGILLLGMLFVALSRREFAGLTVFLNLTSLALVAINLVTGVPALMRSRTASLSATRPATTPAAGMPDIYYIILDGYARADILDSVYHCDNSGFVSWLEQKDFRVADHSRSNYSQTYLSLASSLNMAYLDSMARTLGLESDNRSALLHMIGDSRVVKELRQRGYTIASFVSGYTGTDLANADVHFGPRLALSEFQNVLISTTALPLFLDRVLKRSQSDLHRERILYAFQHLPDAARLKHPVFVFCHILSPHPPFVFGAQGEKTEPQSYFTMTEGGAFQAVDRAKVRGEYVEKYRAQLQFVNAKAKTAIERILAASPRPPVIILQADHGPGSVLNWDDPGPEDLAERFAILNAYLIPGAADSSTANRQSPIHASAPAHSSIVTRQSPIPDSVSPVNSFRLLFDQLFATGYGRLNDKNWFSTIAKPWRFYDVDSPAEYMNSGARLRVSVVAFRAELRSENPGAYCRRLVAMAYPDKSVTIERFYVQGLRLPVESAEDAYRRYQSEVARNELPDLGTQYEWYSGPGPDRVPVTALFFTSEP